MNKFAAGLTEGHLRLLRAAADRTLPVIVTDTEPDSQFDMLLKLVDARFIAASRNDTIHERAFYDIKITLDGYAMLEHSQPDHPTDPSVSVANVEEGYLEKIATASIRAVLSVAAIWAVVHWWSVIVS